jgi:hypothetical protein
MVRWCRRNYDERCTCPYCLREQERRRIESDGPLSVMEGDNDER